MSKKKQPRVVLTIGLDQYLLPNDTGLSTVIRVLSNARRVKGWYTSSSKSVEFDNQPLEISMQFLPETFKPVKNIPKNTTPPPPPPPEPEDAWEPPKDWRKSVEEICAEPDENRRIVPVPVEPVLLYPVRVSDGSPASAAPTTPAPELPAPVRFALPAPAPIITQPFLLE